MDFLKSCRPNLYMVGDVLELTYTIHVPSSEPAQSNFRAILQALREGGILCARQDSKIVVFHPEPVREEQDLEQIQLLLQKPNFKLAIQHRDLLRNDHDKASIGEKTAVELLQCAIDAAIGHALIRDSAVKRLASRTWLFCHDTNSCSILIRLRCHLTSANVLYCAAVFDNVTLVSKNADGYGEHVVICPVGALATTVAPNDPGIIASSAWKKVVTDWLEVEVTEGTEFSEWTAIRLQTEELVVWPSQLLFSKQPVSSNSESNPGWKQWFASGEDTSGFLSPLAFAANWYKGAAERERQAEPLPSFAEQPAAVTIPADATASLATSPPFMQRLADQHAAMSGIYPTPPDGLVHATQIPIQPDNAMQIDTGLSNPDVSLAVTEQTPNAQNGLPQGERDGFDQGSRDLFGDDIGTMDFAGDIGDADFSFFDEPDDAMDENTAEDVVMEDVAHDDDGAGISDKESDRAGAFEEQSRPQSPSAEPSPEENESTAEQAHENSPQKINDEAPDLKHHELPEKPLSPFGIKERLLPPPIPASAILSGSNRDFQQHNRRNSTFEPVTFRDGLNLGSRYTSHHAFAASPRRTDVRSGFDIRLPIKRKKARVKIRDTANDMGSEDVSESEEDSFDSDSSSSDDNMPPKLPWDTKKRKRPSAPESLLQVEGRPGAVEDDENSEGLSKAEAHRLLDRLRYFSDQNWAEHLASPTIFERVWSPMEFYDLSKMDIVFIAQIIGEQSLSATLSVAREIMDGNAPQGDGNCSTEASLQQTTDAVFLQQLWARLVHDLGSLALVKEPPPRPMPAPGQPRPGVLRPHQRADSAALGPDLFSIPPPYVKLQRGTDLYEFLPPALDFWETLSLGPSNGQKDVRAYCVFPSNEELHRLVDGFLSDVATAYESCKLGSHIHVRNVDEDIKLDDYEDGLAPVELNEDLTLEAVLKAFQSTCTQLGTFLANVGHEESGRTFVVYMVNPFSEPEATQCLCICFWLLCKAYRDNAPKPHKKMSRSDIVLQLVPIGLVASNDAPVIPSPKQMAIVAREVYDRCPPSQGEASAIGGALGCLVAPAIELAEPPPKRIGFQLCPDPPGDLMHEGSALHLACTISEDGFWLVAAWTDMTGRYQRTQVFSLRGKTLGEAIEDVWERTKDILQSREVFWRVFVITEFDLDPSIMSSWRGTSDKPRKQPFSVTLMTARADPVLRLLGPLAVPEDAPLQSASGFLTPATTPGGSALTASPDTNQTTAPPTSAPSDSMAAAAESDPDAQFVDLEDETWGILFSQTLAQPEDEVVKPLISGALFKRGRTGRESEPRFASRYLPALHVDLHWTVQVRPNGAVDAGHVKQAEMTLREALRMYRNLSALTRAKGFTTGPDDCDVNLMAWPIHLVAAKKAAKAVNGLLK